MSYEILEKALRNPLAYLDDKDPAVRYLLAYIFVNPELVPDKPCEDPLCTVLSYRFYTAAYAYRENLDELLEGLERINPESFPGPRKFVYYLVKAFLLVRLNRLGEALKVYDFILANAPSLKDTMYPRIRAIALVSKAYILENLGLRTETVKIIEEALREVELSGVHELVKFFRVKYYAYLVQIIAYARMGLLEQVQEVYKKFSKTIEGLQQGLPQRIQEELQACELALKNNVAYVHYVVGDLETAKRMYLETLRLTEGSTRRRALLRKNNALTNLGDISLEEAMIREDKELIRKALKYYKESLVLSKELGEMSEYMYSLRGIAKCKVLLRERGFDQVAATFEEIRNLHTKIKSTERYEVLLDLSIILLNLDRRRGEEYALRTLTELLKNLGEVYDVVVARLLLQLVLKLTNRGVFIEV